ncbi:MAG: type II toxin-antitoxin system MqsA family antitoxin [Nitrospira sp.]|nr:type II toxin-antitoxin system MqsA family antitoxin [Nitrospira sp.]
MTDYADCTFCGGEVEERHINYDYRCSDHLLVLRNVPAGVCKQCGEKYFTPYVLKRMDQSFHNIFRTSPAAGPSIRRARRQLLTRPLPLFHTEGNKNVHY